MLRRRRQCKSSDGFNISHYDGKMDRRGDKPNVTNQLAKAVPYFEAGFVLVSSLRYEVELKDTVGTVY